MALVALLSPLLLFFGLRWLIVLPFIFQVNMYLHFKVQKTIKAYFEGVRALGQLINVGKRLSKLDYPALQEPLAEIEKAYAQVKGFLKIMRHVGVETTDPMLVCDPVLRYTLLGRSTWFLPFARFHFCPPGNSTEAVFGRGGTGRSPRRGFLPYLCPLLLRTTGFVPAKAV